MELRKWNISDGSPVQGDLRLERLSDDEARRLRKGAVLKRCETGSMRLLEGEVTGHHHTIVGKYSLEGAAQFRDDGLAREVEAASLQGSAMLYEDRDLAASLPWLLRTDLMIGFLHVDGGPVNLEHPEHDAIQLPEGTYYVGRQIESAGAEERIVAD